MPRRGENIRKRKDGRWEGRYCVYDEASGTSSLRSVYARSYSEAKAKLADAKLQNQKNTNGSMAVMPKEDGEITFGRVAALWLKSVSASKKHSTYVKYISIYQKYLMHNLAEYR